MDSRRPTQRDPSPSRESVSSGSNSEDEDLEEVTDSLLGTSLTVNKPVLLDITISRLPSPSKKRDNRYELHIRQPAHAMELC